MSNIIRLAPYAGVKSQNEDGITVANKLWNLGEPRFEGAVEFDGEGEQVVISNTSENGFIHSDSFTLSGWFRITYYENTKTSFIHCGNNLHSFGISRINSTIRVGVRGSEGNGTMRTIISNVDSISHKWVYLTMTYSGASKRMIGYVNAEERDNIITNEDFVGNGSYIVLGSTATGGSTTNGDEQNGNACHVQIWNRVLSQFEIQQNMYKRLSGNEIGLVAYYPLDKIENGNVYDLTPNQNHGSINGSPIVVSPFNPIWVNNNRPEISKNNKLCIEKSTKNYYDTSGKFERKNVTVPDPKLNYTLSYDGGGRIDIINNDKLAGYWRLDGDALDSSGYDNHGSINGPTAAKGILNESFEFDGINDYISVECTPELRLDGDSYTILSWIKHTPESTTGAIVSKVDYNEGAYRFRYDHHNNRIRLHANYDESLAFDYDITLTPNIWHQIGVAVKNTDDDKIKISFILNGEIVQEQFSNNTISGNDDEINFGSLSGNSQQFTGNIDEIMLFNKSLTSNEIRNLYNYVLNKGKSISFVPSIVSDNGLVGLWRFDKENENIITDNSINNNDGKIIGASLNKNGISKSSLKFVGSNANDRMEFNSENLITNNFSISFWLNFNDGIRHGTEEGTWAGIMENFNGANNRFWVNNTTILFRFIFDGTQQEYTPSISDIKNKWVNFIITYDNEKLKFFQNSNLIAEYDQIGIIDNGTSITRLGVTTTYWLDGLIDELYIYDRALNNNEVEILYNNPPNQITVNPIDSVSVKKIIGYWDFDNNLDDKSGNNYHINSDTPNFVNGVVNQGFYIDTTNNITGRTDEIYLDNTMPFTFSCWVRVDSGVLGDGSNVGTIVGRGSTSNSFGIGYHHDANDLRMGVRGTSTCINTIHIPYGQLVMASFTYNPNGDPFLRSYINGKEFDTRNTDPGEFFRTGIRFGTTHAVHGGGSVDEQTMMIDEPRIYNRVLSAREIKALYDNPPNEAKVDKIQIESGSYPTQYTPNERIAPQTQLKDFLPLEGTIAGVVDLIRDNTTSQRFYQTVNWSSGGDLSQFIVRPDDTFRTGSFGRVGGGGSNAPIPFVWNTFERKTLAFFVTYNNSRLESYILVDGIIYPLSEDDASPNDNSKLDVEIGSSGSDVGGSSFRYENLYRDYEPKVGYTDDQLKEFFSKLTSNTSIQQNKNIIKMSNE